MSKLYRACLLAACTWMGMTLPAVAAAPCDDWAKRLPNVSRKLCDTAGLSEAGARSVKGVPLYRKDVPADKARLRVLVTGGIHGDELSSVSVALHWLQLARDEPVNLAQPVHWRFVPLLNPDGLGARPPRRTNANGVDLNRNFPTPNWERDAAAYWDCLLYTSPSPRD